MSRPEDDFRSHSRTAGGTCRGQANHSVMIVAAIAFIDWRASAKRMFSFRAWARLPSYPTPGGGGEGVPTRGKYHVVDEPADHRDTSGSVLYTSRTAARDACGRRPRIGCGAGPKVV